MEASRMQTFGYKINKFRGSDFSLCLQSAIGRLALCAQGFGHSK